MGQDKRKPRLEGRQQFSASNISLETPHKAYGLYIVLTNVHRSDLSRSEPSILRLFLPFFKRSYNLMK